MEAKLFGMIRLAELNDLDDIVTSKRVYEIFPLVVPLEAPPKTGRHAQNDVQVGQRENQHIPVGGHGAPWRSEQVWQVTLESPSH